MLGLPASAPTPLWLSVLASLLVAVPQLALDRRWARGPLLAILRDEIVPLYYANGGGPSDAWLDKVRANWKSLGPFVTARRMVAEYDERLYRPDRS